MKYLFQLVIAAVLLTATGCKAIDKLTKFDVDYNSSLVYTASGLPINLPVTINSPDVTTNAEEEFAINDTRKDLIESIKLTQATLTITSPQGETFSFLKDIDVYLVADGLPEVLIAHKNSIPNTVGAQIDLDLENVELKEYIKKDAFRLKVTSTTDEAIVSDVNVDVYTKFFVDAKILGI